MSTIDYFYHTDFSSEQEVLSKIPEGPLSDDALIHLSAILSDNDPGESKGKWSVDPMSAEYNLTKAQVVFNGANSRSLPTKYFYTSVLVLEFAVPGETPCGRYYLQYNVPSDNPAAE